MQFRVDSVHVCQHFGSIGEYKAHIHCSIGVHVEYSTEELCSMLGGLHIFHYIPPPHQSPVGLLVCRLYVLVTGL